MKSTNEIYYTKAWAKELLKLFPGYKYITWERFKTMPKVGVMRLHKEMPTVVEDSYIWLSHGDVYFTPIYYRGNDWQKTLTSRS